VSDANVCFHARTCPGTVNLKRLDCAKMYGPAVRGKMEFREGERVSCINVFGL
jgi:hypothetical protein